MRYVRLTKEESKQLKVLFRTTKSGTVRKRSQCLLLSDQGNSMREISRITGIRWLTVVRLFNAWDQATTSKFATLTIASGRGPKLKLSTVEGLFPEILERNNGDMDAVLSELETEHGVKVCKVTLRKYIKKSKF